MDRRQQKTRAAIFTAFERLLERKKYNKITIKDIIDEANVGRTTFYEHFETKDALLDELCSDLFHHIFSDHPHSSTPGTPSHDFSFSQGDSRQIITHILYHLQDNNKSMIRLMCGESSEIFLFYFRNYLNELVLPYLISEMKQQNTSIPAAFLQNHICGSFVGMVQWWVQRGMEETPEELAGYFLAVTEPIL